ncbi:MAG: transglutaminase family protein [bacterium]|nr:transglutaminase family protein [bacterium]
MYYSIQHKTAFRYSQPVTESVMELRMQPRSEGHQQCFSFQVKLEPKASVHSYRDHLGNVIHSFNIPGAHDRLTVIAESLVQLGAPPNVPAMTAAALWDALETSITSADLFDMLLPSELTEPTPLLVQFSQQTGIHRLDDPLSTLWAINRTLHEKFEYVPNSTTVDSPIEEILTTGKGVCQDYAHVMIALVRNLGIPCRYVSGYLYHQHEQGLTAAPDQSHAWVEAYLPTLGWIGFDPTNATLAAERHIRVAVGRDYCDVPPTRGVFKGGAETRLEVGVKVEPSDLLPMNDHTSYPLAEQDEPPTLPANGVRRQAPVQPVDIQIRQQQQQQE